MSNTKKGELKKVETVEKADLPAAPAPTHFQVSVQDTNDLAAVIRDTVSSKYVQELLFLVINRTFYPITKK